MATVTKGKVLRKDLNFWDGISRTASRADSSGGTITSTTIGDAVDVLEVYGSGTDYTLATMNTAKSAVGSNNVSFLFATGTWTVTDDITIPSNITCIVPSGCVFSVSAGKTLTFSGFVFRENDTWTSGSGTVTTTKGSYGLVSDSTDTGTGDALIGRLREAANAEALTYHQYAEASEINLLEYIPNSLHAAILAETSTTDVSTYVQNAINDGCVFAPAGQYRLETEIDMPKGHYIRGQGWTYSTELRTKFLIAHTGVSGFDFKGSFGSGLRDLEVYCDSTNSPKVGILLGRESAASRGQHVFNHVRISGQPTVALVYSIASEQNIFRDCSLDLEAAATGNYCFYTSQGDDLSVDAGLTSSSNIVLFMFNTNMVNRKTAAAAACLYASIGSSSAYIVCENGYWNAAGGSMVEMDLDVDAGPAQGPFIFNNIGGEGSGGTTPTYGFQITSGGTKILQDLQIINCRSGASDYSFYSNSKVALQGLIYKHIKDESTNGIVIDHSLTQSHIDTVEDITFNGLGVASGIFGSVIAYDDDKTLTLISNINGSKVIKKTDAASSVGAETHYANTVVGDRVNVSAHTATYSIKNSANGGIGVDGTIWTNEGATGSIEFDLPAAKVGMHHKFIRVATQTVTVDPSTGENFVGEAAGKYLSLDSDGAILEIFCVVDGAWDYRTTGTVTVEP